MEGWIPDLSIRCPIWALIDIFRISEFWLLLINLILLKSYKKMLKMIKFELKWSKKFRNDDSVAIFVTKITLFGISDF